MQMTQTQKIISGAVIVVILLGGYIYMDKRKNSNLNLNKNTQENISTTTSDNVVALNANGGSGYKVEQVPVEVKNKIIPPHIDRPITFSSSTTYTEEIKNIYISKINSLRDQIRANSTTLLPWIDLGSYYKAIGDYQGALEAWIYVSKSAPTDFISLGNIGNLYAYYLKDNGMAEVYYKKAIANDPKQTYLYIQLAEVYRDVFHDLDKAKAIIDEGLSKIPNDPALLEFKNNLK